MKATKCDKCGISISRLDSPLFTVYGKTFRNQTVEMDFNHFENCKFVNCTISFKYGNFHLINCTIDGCKLKLDYPAEMVALVLKAYYKNKPINIIGK